MLGISPIGRLDRISPDAHSGRIVGEYVGDDHVVLPVLDGDSRAVVEKPVADDPRAEAVPAPHPVLASLDVITNEDVAAERRLDSVCWGEAEIVHVKKIVVGSALSGVHRALSGPQEHSVTAVRHGVESDDVLVALLVHQQVGSVLSAPIEAVAVATDVVVDLIVHDRVAARPVQSDSESGVEREVVVPDAKPVRAHQHQSVHSPSDGIAADLAGLDVAQVRARAVAQPLILLVVVEREPV